MLGAGCVHPQGLVLGEAISGPDRAVRTSMLQAPLAAGLGPRSVWAPWAGAAGAASSAIKCSRGPGRAAARKPGPGLCCSLLGRAVGSRHCPSHCSAGMGPFDPRSGPVTKPGCLTGAAASPPQSRRVFASCQCLPSPRAAMLAGCCLAASGIVRLWQQLITFCSLPPPAQVDACGCCPGPLPWARCCNVPGCAHLWLCSGTLCSASAHDEFAAPGDLRLPPHPQPGQCGARGQGLKRWYSHWSGMI